MYVRLEFCKTFADRDVKKSVEKESEGEFTAVN